MLQAISRQVWKPLKSLIGEAPSASLEHPTAFLRITREEGELLYKHALDSGITCNIANLCMLLLLSFSFQRSQVLRESTIDEFVLVPAGTHYKFSFNDRRFKSASSGGSSSMPPVSHFTLRPDQSMITTYICFARSSASTTRKGGCLPTPRARAGLRKMFLPGSKGLAFNGWASKTSGRTVAAHFGPRTPSTLDRSMSPI